MKPTSMNFVALSAGLLSISLTGMALAGNGNGGSQFEPYVASAGVLEFTGQMIARPLQSQQGLDQGLSEIEIASIRKSAVAQINASATVLEYVWQTDEYIIQLPAGVTENQLAKQLLATGEFDYVEPNWMAYPTEVPNDSRLGSQWHHKPDTTDSYGGWDVYTGDPSVSVGICDTGVKTTHEDLQLHRLEGYNAPSKKWENAGGQITDINGHGTWCTGTAAANGNNGKGVSGMGWDLSHRMLRVTNNSGGGAYMSDLTHAARTAADAGDRCASVSYSGAEGSSARSAATYAKSVGSLVFWSAGNEGRRMSGDRDNDDLLVIGATTSSDNKSNFSNYGGYVDFMAGGSGIYTTDRGNNSSYRAVDGTSFSCPMAAGLAALIWSADPSLSPDQVEAVLKATCTDLGATGVDDTFGYGRIDSKDALEAIGTYSLSIEPGPPVLGGSNVHFVTKNGDPNKLTALFYSTKGEGWTEIAPGIFLDLRNPKQIKPTKNSNNNGDADWGVKLPNTGMRVFMQAVQQTANKTPATWYIDIIKQ